MSQALIEHCCPFAPPFLLSALLHSALSLGGWPPRNCMNSLNKAVYSNTKWSLGLSFPLSQGIIRSSHICPLGDLAGSWGDRSQKPWAGLALLDTRKVSLFSIVPRKRDIIVRPHERPMETGRGLGWLSLLGTCWIQGWHTFTCFVIVTACLVVVFLLLWILLFLTTILPEGFPASQPQGVPALCFLPISAYLWLQLLMALHGPDYMASLHALHVVCVCPDQLSHSWLPSRLFQGQELGRPGLSLLGQNF